MSYRAAIVLLLACFVYGAASSRYYTYRRFCRPIYVKYAKYLNRFYYYGSTVTYSCPSHYDLVGHATLTCLYGGKWNKPAPECRPKIRTCPRPEDPDNGRVVGSDDDKFKPGQKIWFQCDRGYTLVGTKDFRCQDSGRWHPSEFPVCVACPRPDTPDNGRLHPVQNIYQVGQRVDFKCDKNFDLKGAGWIKCLNTGKWTAPEPTCVARIRTCPRPEDPDNGRVVGSDDDQFKPGQKIWFQCDKGYTLVGTKDFRCQDSGRWHPSEFPVCVACPRPDTPDNGRLHPVQNVYQVGQRVDFKCDKNFDLKGAGWIKCLNTGKWTAPEPTCVQRIRTCPRPEDPDNGRVVGSDDDEFKPGQKIWFQCDRGYTLVGTKDFRCQDTGRWHPNEFPVCVACPRPDTPDNGRLHPVQNIYQVGQRVDFKCDKNFDLKGAGWIKCLNTGKWTAPEPICVARFRTCPRPEDPDNGRVVGSDDDEFKPGQKIWFQCDKGFTLVGTKDFRCQDTGRWHPSEFPVCVGSQHQTVVACERDYRVHVRCPHGQKIQVVSGFYGRKNRTTCPHKYSIFSTNCEARDGLKKLQKYCHNQSHCRLYPSNRVFGDPCRHTHKYIQLTYFCSKGH